MSTPPANTPAEGHSQAQRQLEVGLAATAGAHIDGPPKAAPTTALSAADFLAVGRHLREDGEPLDGALADRVADFLRQHAPTLAELSACLSRALSAPDAAPASGARP